MGFGQLFSDALSSAGQAGRDAAQKVGAAAASAAAKTAELAESAGAAVVRASETVAQATKTVAKATVETAKMAVDLTGQAVVATAKAGTKVAEATVEGGAYVGRKVLAAEVVGATAVVGAGTYAAAKVVSTAGGAVGGALGKVRDSLGAVKERFAPHQPVAEPCLPCLDIASPAKRRARIERRNALIEQARGSDDPELRRAAAELRDDMKAVEMARLSGNAYDQFDPTVKGRKRPPPGPWHALTPEEAKKAGISPALLDAAKAVVYKLPDDFPFEPKVVVAFRGTTSETEDVLTDHDQALGNTTAQYDASVKLGKQLAETFPGAEVTGHSLGGGKAQAAGVAGNLKGEMFNSAGLHPNSVGLGPDETQRYAGLFKQYRAEGGVSKGGGDPLTGLQNSPTAQKAAYGLAKGAQAVGKANAWALQELGVDSPLDVLPVSAQPLAEGLAERILNTTPQEAAENWKFSGGKWYVPPALGEVRGLTSKQADGSDSPIASQHSIVNLIYGFETRKSDDIQTLLNATDSRAPMSYYIGPLTMN